MPIKTQIPYQSGIFFITFTCFQWLPLINITNGYDIVYKWFDYLNKKQNYIIGYVIMPNHVHALIGFRNSGKHINTIIGNGKRFMAYELIARLKLMNNYILLDKLSGVVNHSDRMRNKLHEVWENSFDWKQCESHKMITQKLDYMHCNPCSGKWTLIETPVDYLHSSAKFYSMTEQGIYPVINFMELEDVDLSKPIKS